MSGASNMKQSTNTQILDLPGFLSFEGDDGNIAYSDGVVYYRSAAVWQPLLGFGQIRAGNNIVITSNLTTLTISTDPRVGDVSGPGFSTDNAVARFDGTTGKIIQNSNAILDDFGNLALGGSLSGINATLSNQLNAANVVTDRLTVNRIEKFPGVNGGAIDFSGILASNFRLERSSANIAATSVIIYDAATGGALSPQPALAFPVNLILRKFGTSVRALVSPIFYNTTLLPDPDLTLTQFIIATFNIPTEFLATWDNLVRLGVTEVNFINNRNGALFNSIVQRAASAPVGYTSCAVEGDSTNPQMSVLIGYSSIILGGKERLRVENLPFVYQTASPVSTFP